MPSGSRLRPFLSAIGVVALAISPFLIYLAFQVFDSEGPTAVTTDQQSDEFLSPSPELSIAPSASVASTSLPASSITVEVRNAGGAAGSASDIADRLQSSGYVITDVRDHAGESVNGIVVLYREDMTKGDQVSTFLSAGPSGPLIEGASTTADVLVLVGRP